MDLSKIQLLIKVDLYVIKHNNAKKKGKSVLHSELDVRDARRKFAMNRVDKS